MATRKERLTEFFHRLAAQSPAESEDQALDALGRVLIEVENELTNIPFDASFPLNDGRMYPPKADSRRSVPGRTDLARYRSRSHNTFVSSSGAIRVEEVGGKCVFEKAGKDGSQIGQV